MQEKLTIVDVPWHRQPLGLLTSQSACSPGGRPYSPYPYRDLPKTPSEWPSHARNTKSTPAETQQSHSGNFHLFSYLPAELRLQIWRQAMLSACSHGRVHRVELAITDSEPASSGLNSKPTLHILPTSDLVASTRATRALLASCSEARYELLSLNNNSSSSSTTITGTTLPDTLPISLPPTPTPTQTQAHPTPTRTRTPTPIHTPPPTNTHPQPAGILRLNLTHDILLLPPLTSTLLFALSDARHAHPSLFAPLRGVRLVGLDVAPLLAESEGCGGGGAGGGRGLLFPGAAVSPEVESALVGVVGAGLPRVEGVFLLSGGGRAGVDAGLVGMGFGGGGVVGGPGGEGEGGEGGEGGGEGGEGGRGQGCVFAGADGDAGGVGKEWYTTSPFPSYYVDWEYYARLTKTMRFLCQFRQAMDAPAVVTDLDDEAGLERLEDVKLRLLGHYVTREDGADSEGLELSSPEKCLEVALGKEPRWVQWEWVCQCLDC